MPRETGRCRTRRKEAEHPGRPTALRPDGPPARGKQPLRVFGKTHPANCPGSLRETQGHHLSAHRFARSAGRLSANGKSHSGEDRKSLRAKGASEQLGETEQAHL